MLIKNIKSLRIEAADGIQLLTEAFGVEASKTTLSSETAINGAVTQSGGDMSSNGVVVHTHKHGGVKFGNDTSGGPA
ncbi:hypothetical protein [Pantoea ananatis]|uniref:hypothetical protein n=1 Tax=Pantoea ananas TaxID=553 RepID=UPI001FF0C20E|nr:hypothetical protein [Pantoea ananatis]